jgi:hypothetical protein
LNFGLNVSFFLGSEIGLNSEHLTLFLDRFAHAKGSNFAGDELKKFRYIHHVSSKSYREHFIFIEFLYEVDKPFITRKTFSEVFGSQGLRNGRESVIFDIITESHNSF